MLAETDLRARCLALKGAVEDFPFGADVRVLKVVGRMFALIPVGAAPARISLKVDPPLGGLLRDTYPAITPGYHLNKRHWITILCDDSVPEDVVQEQIERSYALVVKGLSRAEKAQLAAL